MENTNDKEKFEIGAYVKLKSDPTQIFKVLGSNNIHVYASDRNEVPKLIDIANVELCNEDDIISFGDNTPIFVDPKDLK